jgi:hypothetical protein
VVVGSLALRASSVQQSYAMSTRSSSTKIFSRKYVLGLSALLAIGFVGYLYYTRPSSQWGWACQQSQQGGHVKLGLEEQNRLIEAIYQVLYILTVSQVVTHDGVYQNI